MNGLGQMFVDGANSDGISKTSLFGETVLGVLRAEHVQAVLNASSYVVQIPIFQKHFEMFLGRRSLLSLMGDEWRVVRKYMARAFNREYLKEMVGDVCHVTNAFLKALEGRHGQVLDFWPLLKCITLDVIGQTGFGYDFNCAGALTPSPVALAFEFMLEELTARPNSPVDPRLYFYSWPSARNRKHAACNATVRNTLTTLIARRKQERLDPALVGEEHRDMLKYMLDAHEEDDVSVAADTETLVDNLLTILFAGYDTSSITLTYVLAFR
jgi:cytochrome P450